MDTSDCFILGSITRAFGFKGEVVVYLDVDDPEKYKNLESVFVQIEGKLIPFFIKKWSLRPNSREAVAAFEGMDSEEKATAMRGRPVYLPLSRLPKLGENQFYYHEVEGFMVNDLEKGRIGELISVLDLPGNPLLQIAHGSKEVLIPLRDEFISKVDKAQRVLYIKSPPGLIDLYLNESESLEDE